MNTESLRGICAISEICVGFLTPRRCPRPSRFEIVRVSKSRRRSRRGATRARRFRRWTLRLATAIGTGRASDTFVLPLRLRVFAVNRSSAGQHDRGTSFAAQNRPPEVPEEPKLRNLPDAASAALVPVCPGQSAADVTTRERRMTISERAITTSRRTIESYETYARDYDALVSPTPPPDVVCVLIHIAVSGQ